MEDFQPALDILQSKAYIALIQLVKVVLGDAPAVMVEPDKELVAAGILREVDKTGVAVFEDVVHQFLDDPEDDQLILGLQAFPVVVETGAGIHAAGAADLLEQVIDRRFQPEVFEGGGHQAMGNVSDELDGIVDDLLGIVDALQLGCLVQVDQVLIEVEPGGGQQGAGVIVEVGCDPLAFFFLEADRGIQEQFLLVMLHSLQLELVTDDFTLMKNNKNDQPDGQGQHTNGAKV